ncbi:MAG: PKD domain-containing protein, partial [Bacteroidota bacterium]|nr:PKD domain-containing protein [Bacteroidota bacterium]
MNSNFLLINRFKLVVLSCLVLILPTGVFGQTISTTNPASGTSVCGGSTTTVDYTTAGGPTFNAGNNFNVQLSDAAGDFTTPTIIGTVASTATSGTISVTFPNTAGSGYRVRVVSTDVAYTGSDNANDITITVNDAVANAGSDQTVCSTSPSVTLAGSKSGTDITSSLWTTSGTGSFDNTSLLAAVYTPSAGDIIAGTVTLTLTTNDPAGPCGAAVDAMVVTINSAATVNANSDQTVCSSSPAVTLAGSIGGGASSSTWTTSGTGTFDVATSLTAVYTPSGADITAGTVTLTLTTNDPAGPCPSVNDAMVVTINPAATVSANVDQTVCSSSPAVTLAGSIGGGASSSTWTTSGTGTFDVATSLTAVYTPSGADITAGTVTLTLTTNDPAGPCPSVNDAMVVTLNRLTSGVIAADQTICSGGDPAAFTESTGSTGDGALTYRWELNTNISSPSWSTIGGATSTTYNAGVLTADAQYRRVTISTLNSVACESTSTERTVTVNNLTAGVIAGSQTICSGFDPAAFTETTASTSDGAITYRWEVNTNIAVPSWSTIDGATLITYDAGVLTSTTQYRRVSISTLNAIACEEISNVLTVTVNQNPTASFTINDFDQCLTPNSYTVTNTSSNGTGTINAWSWSATGALPVPAATVGPHTFSYASAGSKTVNLTVTDDNGCTNSTSYSNNITVWSNPVAAFTINDNTQCLIGNSFTLTNASTNGSSAITTWAWSTTDATNATETGVGPHTTAYAAYGFKTVNLTVTDGNLCTNATSYTNNITVYQHPTASFATTESSGNTNNDNIICTGAVVHFTGAASTYGFGASSLSYQYKVDGSNAGAGSTSSLYEPVVTGITNPDDYLYTLLVTDNNGCTNETSPGTHIYVHPYPVPAISTPTIGTQGLYGVVLDNGNGGQLLCHGKVVFDNSSTIPSGSIVSYLWSFGDATTTTTTTTENVKHEYPVNYGINWFDAAFPNTRYTIGMTAVSNIGCSTSTAISRDIKNGPDAIINLTPSTSQPLATNSFPFGNGSQNRHPSFITSSLWNFGDGTSTTNQLFIPKVYTSAGDYRVHLITYTNTGCTDTTYMDVTVTPGASASFTYVPNSCANKDVAFTSTSVSASTYLWDFGDASTSTLANPTHTYAANGSYVVTLTINGSLVSAPQTIVVATTPSVGAITSTMSACGNTYTFSNVSTGQTLTYAWSFGGAAVFTPTAPSTTSSISGTYGSAAAATVDLVVTADARCPASATQLSFTSVAAGASVVAGVTVTATTDFCANTRTVNNTSTGGGTYELDIDGAGFASVGFPYALSGLSAGTHSVTIRVTNGSCITTATASFDVSVPTPSFSYSAATCGQAVAFTNTSTSTGTGTTTYSWNFNSGEGTSTSTSPSFTFATGGTKTVTLTATASSGCVASSTNAAVAVSATAGPIASFTSAVAPGTCANRIQFTNTSSGVGSTYAWNFGDGNTSTETSPLKGYGSAGPFTVTLTATNGACSSVATASVSISSSANGPAAGFTVNSTPQILASNNFNFFNTTQHMGFGWVTSYTWNFGDATTSTNTFIYGKTYASAGTYTVTLTAVSSNGCTDVTQQTVVVTAAASAAFSASTNNCTNRDVTFTNTSVSSSSNSWNFGDGSPASTSTSPTHTYAADGSYTVTLTINGSTSVSHTVVVATTPSVGAITSTMSACGNVYTFSNVSTGQTLTYAWSFGGAAVFTPTAPSTTSSISGTYGSAAAATVDLVVTADGRCPASATQLSFTSVAAGASVVAGVTVTATTDFCANTRTVNNTSTGGGT